MPTLLQNLGSTRRYDTSTHLHPHAENLDRGSGSHGVGLGTPCTPDKIHHVRGDSDWLALSPISFRTQQDDTWDPSSDPRSGSAQPAMTILTMAIESD